MHHYINPAHFNATAAEIIERANNLCLDPIAGKTYVKFTQSPNPEMAIESRLLVLFILGSNHKMKITNNKK